MKLVDINILLYVVNRDAAQHRTVLRWWEQAVRDDEQIGLAWVVLLGFLRLATRPGVFANPLTVREASEQIAEWLALPNVRLAAESEHHWLVLRELLAEVGAAANLTTDAHLAALAITRGATLVSCDQDFGRFSKLRWENPVAK